MDFQTFGSVLLLILGFGFVIFIHELGHFLAAKWADVKVEQFAVGFGQALVSWRKGMGFTVGSSGKKLAELEEAVKAGTSNVDLSKIGETEYRLNWIPLGGYVKMLGQDDMDPNAQSVDPRAYNKKPVGKRMVIISAGVIMNIILAAVGFMALFLMGFDAPSPVVGNVQAGSPAQRATTVDGKPAPIQVGDRILTINGKTQHDFTKIALNTALLENGAAAQVTVLRRDGREETVLVTPARPAAAPSSFLLMGIGQANELRGVKRLPKEYNADEAPYTLSPGLLTVAPGEWISHISGVRVASSEQEASDVKHYWRLDAALQDSGGKPVPVTVVTKDGAVDREIKPHFAGSFDQVSLNFAGLLPRATVSSVEGSSSPVFKQVLPDDVVIRVSSAGDPTLNPSMTELREVLNKAGQEGQEISLRLLRNGQEIDVGPLVPGMRLGEGRRGLGIGLGVDEQHAVVADVMNDSAAAVAGIPRGATITSVNGTPTASWFDVHGALQDAVAGEPVAVEAQLASGETRTFELKLSDADVAAIDGYRYTHAILLHDGIEARKTSNPLTAAAWGVTETRDFILQFYLTLKRMVQGTVPLKNMMGPVGIVDAGAKFADRGMDWLLWFLCMISANLAVVNFLPIPIVDGGHFMFLLLEKIKGKPLGPKAQSVMQLLGLALLLSVFVLVTYQDVVRLFRL